MIKKILLSCLIAALLIVSLPLTMTVSAETLNTEATLNKLEELDTHTRYEGTGQCYGFARRAFASLYDLNLSDVTWNYNNGTTRSDKLYTVMTTRSTSELNDLYNTAQPGDVFCYGGGGGNPHSMIFVSNDAENGEVSVLDANWGSDNLIQTHDISYAQLKNIVRKGNTVSLLRFSPVSVKLNASASTLYIGGDSETESTQLTCTIAPSTTPAPVWTSSDETVATVDENGKVYGKNVGTAVITCTVGDKKDTCLVTVELSKLAYEDTEYSFLQTFVIKPLLQNNSVPLSVDQSLLIPYKDDTSAGESIHNFELLN